LKIDTRVSWKTRKGKEKKNEVKPGSKKEKKKKKTKKKKRKKKKKKKKIRSCYGLESSLVRHYERSGDQRKNPLREENGNPL